MSPLAPTHADPETPAILAELATACLATACPLAETLAVRLGLDPIAVWADLQALERAGLVECWADDPDGPSATLSGLMADRLGLTLADNGERWITLIEASRVRRGRPAGEGDEMADLGKFGLVPDTDAEEAFEQFVEIEEHEARSRLRPALLRDQAAELKRRLAMPRAERLSRMLDGELATYGFELDSIQSYVPKPTVLLGLGVMWPVMVPGSSPPRPWKPGDGDCPVCRGGPLGRRVLCLSCLRSGVDESLPVVLPFASKVPKGDRKKAGSKKGAKVPAVMLRGGVGR